MTARVIVTRASAQAGYLESALRTQGLQPIGVPAIAVEIDPPGGQLDAVARVLHTFDWVVITSPNGARAIVAAAERVFTSLGTPDWAAMGDSTAEILEREGVQVAFRPSRPDARTLADELPFAARQVVVLLRGDLASDDLPDRLRRRGAVVTNVVAYRTLEGPPSSGPLLCEAFAEGRPDAVLLASGSAARGLVSLAEAEGLDVTSLPAVCIGPETAREAARLGFHVLATSPEPDPGSLAATTAAALAQPMEKR
jgi:uroporphyrinogen-III synthase